jgi:hypothetical protein
MKFFARFAGISELILTANRLGGHGSMHIGLSAASEIERGQWSHETAMPDSRKIRVASASAAIRIGGATEAQLYTCTVMPRPVSGGRATAGPVNKKAPRSGAIKQFKKRREPQAVVIKQPRRELALKTETSRKILD